MNNSTRNEIDFYHPLYQEHYDQVKLCQDMYKGIDDSLHYLLQSTNENDKDYAVRRKLAVLEPMFERVVTAQVGQIYRKQITFEDVHTNIKDWLDEDMHIDSFLRDATRDAIRDGKAFVFVDLPKDGGEPYILHVNRTQLINWRKDLDGKFTMAVIRELYQVEEEFRVEFRWQYRHILPNGNHDIYRGDNGQYEIYESINTFYDFVPLYEADLGDVPPNFDIAEMNRVYFNCASMTGNAIRKATDPSLLTIGLGLDDNTELKLGVNATINTDNPEADVRWVELNGQSIPIAKEDLKDQKEAMAERALTLQNQGIGKKTATQVNKESSESSARLTDISTEMELMINKVYEAVHQMKFKTEATGKIKLPFDFKDEHADSNAIAQMNQLWVSGAITQKTLLETLVEKELLNVEDIEEEIKQTEAEGIPNEYVTDNQPADKQPSK